MQTIVPSYWVDACTYLSQRDEKLAAIIAQYKDETPSRSSDPLYTLIRAIVGQQISVKAADSIWSRVHQLLGNNYAQSLVVQPIDELRSCGLSQQKARYLINVAEFFVQGKWQAIADADEEDIRQALLEIKGIGEWTWQMFALFYLQLPDIFPIKDIGLVNACKQVYGHTSTEKTLLYSEQWKPYRSVATWYLWRYLDPVAVVY